MATTETTPEQVPADLVAAAQRAYLETPATRGGSPVRIRAALAAVLPAHEAMVREQVAKELRDYAGERGEKWMPLIWETIRHCANLARGEF
jgi:hypothetical protein